MKNEKKLHGFSYSKSMANFEAFRQNFLSSTNPRIVRSALVICLLQFLKIFWTEHAAPTLFRNKRFMLDEMLQRNASKFAILLEYENPSSFFRFSFHATLFFP